MSYIDEWQSIQLQTIHQILHQALKAHLKMLGCYCYFWQYYYYFSIFQVNSSIFWYRSWDLHSHLRVIDLYSSLSKVQRPNFLVIKSHLHKIGWFVDSYTLRIIFHILSCEHSISISNSFRIWDALKEVLFFSKDLRRKD